MYLISEVADKLGISKTAVYNKLSKLELKDKLIKQNGITYIDDDLFKLLEGSFKPKATEKTTVEDTSNKFDATLINALTEQLSVLHRQLEVKDAQIADLSRLLENQQKLLGNAQRNEEVKLLDVPEKEGLFARFFK